MNESSSWIIKDCDKVRKKVGELELWKYDTYEDKYYSQKTWLYKRELPKYEEDFNLAHKLIRELSVEEFEIFKMALACIAMAPEECNYTMTEWLLKYMTPMDICNAWIYTKTNEKKE